MEESILENINTEKDYEEFLEYLFTKQDLKYRDFNSKIIVIDIENTIGIRSPIIKDIVKKISKSCYKSYIDIFEKLLENNKIKFFEEKLIYALVISSIKEDLKTKFQKIDKVIELVDNWAICDSFISSAKFVNKNKDEFFKYLLEKINSKNAWELRFILVSFLTYYMEEKYLEQIFKVCENIKTEHYYVNMAKAWLLSICYIHFKKETFNFLKDCELDKWTVNKSVQKIRESLRVNKEEKEKVLELKRK